MGTKRCIDKCCKLELSIHKGGILQDFASMFPNVFSFDLYGTVKIESVLWNVLSFWLFVSNAGRMSLKAGPSGPWSCASMRDSGRYVRGTGPMRAH